METNTAKAEQVAVPMETNTGYHRPTENSSKGKGVYIGIGITLIVLLIAGGVVFGVLYLNPADSDSTNNSNFGSAVYDQSSTTDQPSIMPSSNPTMQTMSPSEQPTEIPTFMDLDDIIELPGIYSMNKIYNPFQGKEIYNQVGRDIMRFTFNDGRTSSGYDVPDQLSSIPNIAPSCQQLASVSEVYYATSTSMLSQQASSASFGFQADVDLGISADFAGLSASASTQMQFGLMFGHSSSSSSAFSQSESGYTYSFKMSAENTLYIASIDWDNDNLRWIDGYTDALLNLRQNMTNQSIFAFIHDWGSHVLDEAQTGSYCQETAYVSASGSATSTESFRDTVNSASQSFAFWSSSTETSSSKQQSGTTSNGDSYQFDDIRCDGEVKVSSTICSAVTADEHNPIITSYQWKPIWTTNYFIDIVGDDNIDKIDIFFNGLFQSLYDCGTTYCNNNNGICILNSNIWNDAFISNWNGDFSSLWTTDDGDQPLCFCNDGYYGSNCGETSVCSCTGNTDCCCNDDKTCNDGNICSPIDNMCVEEQNPTIQCGGKGVFHQCTQGIVTGACGSGTYDDCSTGSGLCPDNSWSGIQCNYAEFDGLIDKLTASWQCRGWGGKNSCQDNPNGGDIMIGICGSGIWKDCKAECSGYSGVSCASMSGLTVDYNDCQWIDQYSWGAFVYCNDGYVATGWCGSGSTRDCEGNTAQLQCCKLIYS